MKRDMKRYHMVKKTKTIKADDAIDLFIKSHHPKVYPFAHINGYRETTTKICKGIEQDIFHKHEHLTDTQINKFITLSLFHFIPIDVNSFKESNWMSTMYILSYDMIELLATKYSFTTKHVDRIIKYTPIAYDFSGLQFSNHDRSTYFSRKPSFKWVEILLEHDYKFTSEQIINLAKVGFCDLLKQKNKLTHEEINILVVNGIDYDDYINILKTYNMLPINEDLQYIDLDVSNFQELIALYGLVLDENSIFALVHNVHGIRNPSYVRNVLKYAIIMFLPKQSSASQKEQLNNVLSYLCKHALCFGINVLRDIIDEFAHKNILPTNDDVDNILISNRSHKKDIAPLIKHILQFVKPTVKNFITAYRRQQDAKITNDHMTIFAHITFPTLKCLKYVIKYDDLSLAHCICKYKCWRITNRTIKKIKSSNMLQILLTKCKIHMNFETLKILILNRVLMPKQKDNMGSYRDFCEKYNIIYDEDQIYELYHLAFAGHIESYLCKWDNQQLMDNRINMFTKYNRMNFYGNCQDLSVTIIDDQCAFDNCLFMNNYHRQTSIALIYNLLLHGKNFTMGSFLRFNSLYRQPGIKINMSELAKDKTSIVKLPFKIPVIPVDEKSDVRFFVKMLLLLYKNSHIYPPKSYVAPDEPEIVENYINILADDYANARTFIDIISNVYPFDRELTTYISDQYLLCYLIKHDIITNFIDLELFEIFCCRQLIVPNLQKYNFDVDTLYNICHKYVFFPLAYRSLFTKPIHKFRAKFIFGASKLALKQIIKDTGLIPDQYCFDIATTYGRDQIIRWLVRKYNLKPTHITCFRMFILHFQPSTYSDMTNHLELCSNFESVKRSISFQTLESELRLPVEMILQILPPKHPIISIVLMDGIYDHLLIDIPCKFTVTIQN